MHSINMLWGAYNEEVLITRRARGIYRDYVEIINEMSEILFIKRFRLDKATFQNFCEDLRRQTSLKGTIEISVEVKVLCALSFLATGSYQRIVGVSHHLPQRTVSRIIKQVVEALNHSAIMAKWIRFPKTRHDRGITKTKICDSELCITNVNAKFGGATHDSHIIWSSSRVESYMQELHQNNEQVWLLGDSGYPQHPWLMTPILNAVQGSRKYTHMHVQARIPIEHCFGLLKARWRCLLKDRVLHYQPYVASKIIMACCVCTT